MHVHIFVISDLKHLPEVAWEQHLNLGLGFALDQRLPMFYFFLLPRNMHKFALQLCQDRIKKNNACRQKMCVHRSSFMKHILNEKILN